MERDELTLALEYSDSNFNSHAHVERDLFLPMMFSMFLHFNSHAHVERDSASSSSVSFISNFNSHAHVERDQVFLP